MSYYMKSIAVIYGTSGDNTKSVATKIVQHLGHATLLDVAQLKPEAFLNYDVLILGTSTWGVGDLLDEWESLLPSVKKLSLSGKTLAFFGLGDSASYSDTFVDGMGHLYEAFQSSGARLVGSVDTSGYDFEASRAVVDGRFVGLALDEDNEYDQTDARIAAWMDELLPIFE